MTDELNRIAILESQLLDEYRRNGELTAELARVTPTGTTCAHCRKSIRKDGDGNWRDAGWLTWCGVGDSKHGVSALPEDKRATQVVKMRREP